MHGQLGYCGRLTGPPQAEVQGSPEVIPLQVDAREHLSLPAAVASHRSAKVTDPIEVSLLSGALLIDLPQAQSSVLAKRFQQRVPSRAVVAQLPFQDRLLDERPEQLHHPLGRHMRIGTDGNGGFVIETSGKYREPGPEQAFRLFEQPVTPGECRLQCLVACLSAAISFAQHCQLAGQTRLS